ncbi:MAG: tetratricopeptide repeat-containing sensor histidine kinase [Flammeovirgaceae bacterium]
MFCKQLRQFLVIFCIYLSFGNAPSIQAQQFDSLYQALENPNHSDSLRAEIQVELLRQYHFHGLWAEGIPEGLKAIRLIDAARFPDQAALAHRWLSVLYRFVNKFDSMEWALRPTKSLQTKVNTKTQATLLFAWGYYYDALYGKTKQQTSSDSLIFYIEKAFDVFATFPKHPNQLAAYEVLISHYIKLNRYVKATELCNQAFTLTEKHHELAYLYRALGNIMLATSEYAKAIEAFQQAIAHLNTAKAKLEVEVFIGFTYFSQKNYQKALMTFQKIKQAENFDRLFYKTQTYVVKMVAECHAMLGDKQTALKGFNALQQLLGQKSTIAASHSTNYSIGCMHIELKQYQQGIPILKRYLAARTDWRSQKHTSTALAEAYEALGDYKNATKYYKIHKEASKYYQQEQDSIREVRQLEKVKELNIQFETERKEQTIALLQEQEQRKDAELKQSRTQNYALVGGLLATVVLAFTFFRARNKQKQANAIIANYNLEIESQNLQLNQQNEELSTTNERLAELNREKDSLMDIVAHDLKSPLNNIVALSELMNLSKADEIEREQLLQQIHQEHQRGEDLVKDLIDLHALEQSSQVVLKSIPIMHLLSERINLMTERAKKKKIRIELERLANPTVPTEIASFNRIVDNLLSNAIKFSGYSSTIHVQLTEQNGKSIVRIQDEGPGFSQADREKLFRKFQKLSAKPTGGESSTGLGLAIVKLLVERLGGEVVLEDTERGACFRLAFPTKDLPSLS